MMSSCNLFDSIDWVMDQSSSIYCVLKTYCLYENISRQVEREGECGPRLRSLTNIGELHQRCSNYMEKYTYAIASSQYALVYVYNQRDVPKYG